MDPVQHCFGRGLQWLPHSHEKPRSDLEYACLLAAGPAVITMRSSRAKCSRGRDLPSVSQSLNSKSCSAASVLTTTLCQSLLSPHVRQYIRQRSELQPGLCTLLLDSAGQAPLQNLPDAQEQALAIIKRLIPPEFMTSLDCARGFVG